MNYDISVKRGLYAKYWFGIREMAERVNGVKVGQVQITLKAKSDLNVNNATVSTIVSPASQQHLSPYHHPQSMQRLGSNTGLSSTATVPKPLTEVEMQRLSASSNFSQTKLRESFKESLYMDEAGSNTATEEPRITRKSEGADGVEIKSKEVFGWGAANLRRSKSDHLFTPTVPPASVL
jgi:hypothetical protein